MQQSLPSRLAANERLSLLEQQLAKVDMLASANELPDASITHAGLKITPLEAAVPEAAQQLIDRTAMMLPHVKITELLLEVDAWTGFTRHFTHLKSGEIAKNKSLLLTAILADAINLGLSKMAEPCPGTTYARLSWLQAWHMRDETYSKALAELVNAQSRHPFARHWGDGSTSSSDGQGFKVGGKAESTGHINPKYGAEPGRTFYPYLSDQFAPYHAKAVNVGVRDATYVLDGLLYHESDLRIEEHYTDTTGFTDHVFALMHLLGFRFAPRLRDLGETRLYVPKQSPAYTALKPMIGGTLQIKSIRAHWDEILRLATSIKQGTVTSWQPMREALASYATRAAEKMRRYKVAAENIFVFMHTNTFNNDPFYWNGASARFAETTNDAGEVVALAVRLGERLWRDGSRYAKCGVMITELLPGTIQQPALWGELDRERRERAWRAMDMLNATLGRDTVRLLSAGPKVAIWKLRAEHRSNRWTRRWDELPKVKAR